jgi:hypothetical protein
MTSDQEFVHAFMAGTLPEDSFHHRDHVRLVWLLLERSTVLETLAAVSEGLRRFAAAKGKPDRYHQTITWAFVFLIAARRALRPRATWEEFIAEHPDLLTWQPSVLDRYYSPEVLGSDLARQIFLLPDRAG